MKVFSIFVFAMLLSGCAAQSTREPPIVDMRGVDAQRYADDLHDCTEQAQGFITFGAPISRCLTQRGYTVTVPKT
jgi:hypothetical protein